MLGLLSALIALVSIFLILLILIQRGKGGGLAGAFGGMGGQSAFGAKAGDTFTKVTAVTACIWIVLCGGTVWYMNHFYSSDLLSEDLGSRAPLEEGEAGMGATNGDATTGDVPPPDGETAADASAAGDAVAVEPAGDATTPSGEDEREPVGEDEN